MSNHTAMELLTRDLRALGALSLEEYISVAFGASFGAASSSFGGEDLKGKGKQKAVDFDYVGIDGEGDGDGAHMALETEPEKREDTGKGKARQVDMVFSQPQSQSQPSSSSQPAQSSSQPSPQSQSQRQSQSQQSQGSRALSRLHQICQRVPGCVIQYEFDEAKYRPDGPGGGFLDKRCTIHITLPSDLSRSYTTPLLSSDGTEVRYRKKTEAKAASAVVALEMGAEVFMLEGNDNAFPLPVSVQEVNEAEGEGEEETVPGLLSNMDLSEIEERYTKAGCVVEWFELKHARSSQVHGAALRIKCPGRPSLTVSVDTTFDSLRDARLACARTALTSELPPPPPLPLPLTFSPSMKSVLPTVSVGITLDTFVSSLPQPLPSPFLPNQSPAEQNAPLRFNTLLQSARGSKLMASFTWFTRDSLHGCVLRLSYPASEPYSGTKSVLVDPVFLKRNDAKSAVCFLALCSNDVVEWINNLAIEVTNRITDEMRLLANGRIFPVLAAEYAKIYPGKTIEWVFHTEREATGAKLDIQPRSYSVPARYRNKVDAKVALACIAVENGVLEFMRFGLAEPPVSYTAYLKEDAKVVMQKARKEWGAYDEGKTAAAATASLASKLREEKERKRKAKEEETLPSGSVVEDEGGRKRRKIEPKGEREGDADDGYSIRIPSPPLPISPPCPTGPAFVGHSLPPKPQPSSSFRLPTQVQVSVRSMHSQSKVSGNGSGNPNLIPISASIATSLSTLYSLGNKWNGNGRGPYHSYSDADRVQGAGVMDLDYGLPNSQVTEETSMKVLGKRKASASSLSGMDANADDDDVSRKRNRHDLSVREDEGEVDTSVSISVPHRPGTSTSTMSMSGSRSRSISPLTPMDLSPSSSPPPTLSANDEQSQSQSQSGASTSTSIGSDPPLLNSKERRRAAQHVRHRSKRREKRRKEWELKVGEAAAAIHEAQIAQAEAILLPHAESDSQEKAPVTPMITAISISMPKMKRKKLSPSGFTSVSGSTCFPPSSSATASAPAAVPDAGREDSGKDSVGKDDTANENGGDGPHVRALIDYCNATNIPLPRFYASVSALHEEKKYHTHLTLLTQRYEFRTLYSVPQDGWERLARKVLGVLRASAQSQT